VRHVISYVFDFVPHFWFLWPLAAAVLTVASVTLCISGRRFLAVSGMVALVGAAGCLGMIYEPGDSTFPTYILPIAATSIVAVAATAGSSLLLSKAWKWVRVGAPLLVGLAIVLVSPIVMLYAACAGGNCV
jgi:hypothetical protein